MAQASSPKPLVGRLLDEHIFGASIAIYTVIAIPAYFWFVGPVGVAGEVDSAVVLWALFLGAIMIVPGIMAFLRSRRVKWGYGRAFED